MSFLDQVGDDMMADDTLPQGNEPATTPASEPPVIDPQPEPAPEPEDPPQGGHIPIQALLDEREKRQEAAREAAELKRQLAQIQAAQQPTARPDLYDDPDAFAADIQRQQAELQFQMRAEMSANFARQKPGGEEDLQAAIAWAGKTNDAYLHQKFSTSSDPYGFLITEYKRDQLFNTIGGDLDGFVRQHYAKLNAGSQTTQQGAPALETQQPASKPAVRSLAAQSGAGPGPTPADAGFDNLTFNLDKKR